jgi:hypothetical protein
VLLVGPGSFAVGSLLASYLCAPPDVDDSCLQGGSNSQRYWLRLGAPDALVKVRGAARRAFAAFLQLEQCLQAEQRLELVPSGDALELRGPGATTLQPALAAFEAEVTSDTRRWLVRREALRLRGLEAEVRAAVRQAMSRARLPACLLDGAPYSGAWRTRWEGPDARHASLPRFRGWPTPATTLAVLGPRLESVCFTNYLRFCAQVPAVVHAQDALAAGWQPTAARHPMQEAALIWSGRGAWRQCAGGYYCGPWPLREPETHAEAAEQRDVMRDWSSRRMRNLLEGRVACRAPGRYRALVRLSAAPAFVEWEDFRSDGERVVAHVGLAQQGYSALRNPGHEGWVACDDAQYEARLTVWPVRGAAFPRAHFREAPRVRLRRLQPHARARVAAAFLTAERHRGLENYLGERVTEPEPLPLCPSQHPQPWEKLSRDFRVEDLEDWARAINAGELACSMCGDCERALNAASPGLWTLRAQEEQLVCVLPTSWQPAQPRLEAPAPKPEGAREPLHEALTRLLGSERARPSEQDLELWTEPQRAGLRMLPRDAEEAQLLSAFLKELRGKDHYGTELAALAQATRCEVKQLRRLLTELDLQLKSAEKRQFVLELLLVACAIRPLVFALRLLLLLLQFRAEGFSARQRWLPGALLEWLDATAAWSPEDCLASARATLEAHRDWTAAAHLAKLRPEPEAFRKVIVATEDAPAARRVPTLAERSEEQAADVVPGSRRWYDDHAQPEHAALLAQHAARELLAQLLALATGEAGVCSEQLEPEILRGEPHILQQEQHDRAPRLAHVAADLRELGVANADFLRLGAGSTTSVTGWCLPRSCAWAD